MNNFLQRLQSRKFLLAFGFGLFVAVNRYFELGMDDKEMNTILISVLAYLAVEGGADAVRALKK